MGHPELLCTLLLKNIDHLDSTENKRLIKDTADVYTLQLQCCIVKTYSFADSLENNQSSKWCVHLTSYKNSTKGLNPG